MISCVRVLFWFQFEEALRRNAQAEYDKLVQRQEIEEAEMKAAADSEVQELRQLQNGIGL